MPLPRRRIIPYNHTKCMAMFPRVLRISWRYLKMVIIYHPCILYHKVKFGSYPRRPWNNGHGPPRLENNQWWIICYGVRLRVVPVVVVVVLAAARVRIRQIIRRFYVVPPKWWWCHRHHHHPVIPLRVPLPPPWIHPIPSPPLMILQQAHRSCNSNHHPLAIPVFDRPNYSLDHVWIL